MHRTALHVQSRSRRSCSALKGARELRGAVAISPGSWPDDTTGKCHQRSFHTSRAAYGSRQGSSTSSTELSSVSDKVSITRDSSHGDNVPLEQQERGSNTTATTARSSLKSLVDSLQLLERRLDESLTNLGPGKKTLRLKSKPQLRSVQLDPDVYQIDAGLRSSQDKHNSTAHARAGSAQPKILKVQLPKSPLEKHHALRKARTTKARETPEDKRSSVLADNPWAHMLSAPTRQCRITRSVAPKSLLLPLDLAKSIADEQVYLMPTSLADLEGLHKELTQTAQGPAITAEPSDDVSPGRTIRVLPQDVFMDALSVELGPPDKKVQKKGGVAKRLFPVRWAEREEVLDDYARASREYWDEIEQNGTEEEKAEREEYFAGTDIKTSDVKWLPGVAERTRSLMGRRVLLAMRYLNYRLRAKTIAARRWDKTMAPMPSDPDLSLTWFSIEPRVIPDQEVGDHESSQDFWNDMGDIEAEGAIDGNSDRQGSKDRSKPPIAQTPQDLDARHDRTDVSKDISGSFFVHIGKPDSQKLASLRRDANDLLPPLIGMEYQHIPVFNVASLLPGELRPYLSELFSRSQHLGKNPDQTELGERLCLVRSGFTGASRLLTELWRLWRYTGGWSGLRGYKSDENSMEAVGKEVGESGDEYKMSDTARKQFEKLLYLDGIIDTSIKQKPRRIPQPVKRLDLSQLG